MTITVSTEDPGVRRRRAEAAARYRARFGAGVAHAYGAETFVWADSAGTRRVLMTMILRYL